VSLFRGDIGQPYGGFPPALQKKILGNVQPLTARPGECCRPSTSIEPGSRRGSHAARDHRPEFASWLMYPKVFRDYMADRNALRRRQRAADASVLLRHWRPARKSRSTSSAAST
jgi:pyruvate carboxylase